MWIGDVTALDKCVTALSILRLASLNAGAFNELTV